MKEKFRIKDSEYNQNLYKQNLLQTTQKEIPHKPNQCLSY